MITIIFDYNMNFVMRQHHKIMLFLLSTFTFKLRPLPFFKKDNKENVKYTPQFFYTYKTPNKKNNIFISTIIYLNYFIF